MSVVEAPVSAEVLPECAAVHWRPRVDERRLDRYASLWTLSTVAHVVPFLCAAALLVALQPLALPVSLVCVAHAWIIPALYAQRGANVVRSSGGGDADAERLSVGLLGDLVGHRARALHRATGLVLEEGRLGVWLLAEGGALLVRPGGRRVNCYCVRVAAPALPSGDRIAHLLLALRSDEAGFATVANLSFSGAAWRVRRRLPEGARPALDAARRIVATT